MAHVINRYPVELIDVVRLADGRRVLLRPVLPQDRDLHHTFFDSLSKESRYNRFLNPMRNLPAGMLERFTEIDHQSHVALVAETFVDGKEVVIGEARYVVEESGDGAELAIAVTDGFQGVGLGTRLLGRLICFASRAGLGRLVGETLATNDNMLRLARKAGFSLRPDQQLSHLIRLEKRLAGTRTASPCQDISGFEERAAA